MARLQTVQKRHSEKWLSRVRNVRHFTLSNGFSGALIADDRAAEVLRWNIEQLGDNLQISPDKATGRLRNHSNSWYEFDVVAA